MKDAWRAFVMAWQFFTIIPAPRIQQPTARDIQRGAYFLPLIGLCLGLVLCAGYWLLSRLFQAPVASFLALLAYSAMSGFLHLDGLMDTADAVGSRKRGDEALSIMKDSRVGAMGVISAVFVLGGKWLALMEMPHGSLGTLVTTPMLARLAVLSAMAVYPSARAEGLGALFARQVAYPRVAIAAVVVCVLSYSVMPPRLFTIQLAITALLVWTVGRWMVRRFGGMTGDTYGAILEISEWALWLAAVAA
ncbi:adenosylcobinamide-GDP ribazoletransferase [Alicyclobacillus acidiphilus]|uniref:adenosylcobinamide-GDP ribazoletransferase n=1 Tax=Alicyclobacillus acidiphilus TaxID=182455 RepID=UPI00082AB185|nr:adenosylcobinamide-GDP ribazoletransferase [Alicyclobacillus acidiphilus]